jgi:hypothetical protein
MDVDVDSKPPREHELSSSFAKTIPIKTDPGYKNPDPQERISKFICYFIRMAPAERMPRPHTQ